MNQLDKVVEVTGLPLLFAAGYTAAANCTAAASCKHASIRAYPIFCNDNVKGCRACEQLLHTQMHVLCFFLSHLCKICVNEGMMHHHR